MSLRYKIIITVAPGSEEKNNRIYFPKLCGGEQINIDDISKDLSLATTVSRTDVCAVIIGLADLFPLYLRQGYSIKLDKLGIFRLHAKTKSSKCVDKVSAKNIKQLRLSFIPDKQIRKEL